MRFITKNNIITAILALNLILSTYAVVTLVNHTKRIDTVSNGMAEVAQVLGRSGIIGKSDTGFIINRVVTVADLEAQAKQ